MVNISQYKLLNFMKLVHMSSKLRTLCLIFLYVLLSSAHTPDFICPIGFISERAHIDRITVSPNHKLIAYNTLNKS